MSSTRPSRLLLGVGVVAVPGLPHANHTPVAAATARYVDVQCKAAALAVAEAGGVGREIRSPGGPADPPRAPRVTGWYEGAAPGQYVAVVQARRAGKPVRLRVIVDARRKPCALTSWRVAPPG